MSSSDLTKSVVGGGSDPSDANKPTRPTKRTRANRGTTDAKRLARTAYSTSVRILRSRTRSHGTVRIAVTCSSRKAGSSKCLDLQSQGENERIRLTLGGSSISKNRFGSSF